MALQEQSHQFFNGNSLIETAITSLNRLNLTVNEMKRWTSERASLQRDVWRLQTALQTIRHTTPGILLSRDPLVRHQSQEINRLAITNNSMKTKLQSMNNVLQETERTIAWNVDRRVRSKLTRMNSQVAEERLHLAQEIARLKQQLNDTNTNETMQRIKRELCEFAEGDRKLDRYFGIVANRVIRIVTDLSNKLLKVGEILEQSERQRIHLQNESMQLKCLLSEKDECEPQVKYKSCDVQPGIQQFERQTEEINADELKANSINLQTIKSEVAKLNEEKELLLQEKAMREKALARNVSGIKTKLTIALMENEKLNKKIKCLEHDIATKLNTVKTELSIQTEGEVKRLQSLLELTKAESRKSNARLVYLEEKWNHSTEGGDLESELITLRERNNEMVIQLVMERTTAQEALKQFERSAKEIERLGAELEDVNLERVTLKKELAKIRMENSELRDARMIYMKKCTTLSEENTKERQSLQVKIRLLKMRVNKLMGDLKKSGDKTHQHGDTVRVLEEEKIRLHKQVDELTKRLEELINDLKTIQDKNSELESAKEQLVLEKEQWTIQHNNLNEKLNDIVVQIEQYKTENFNVSELLRKSNEVNEELKSECQKNISEIGILTNELRDAENECEELRIRIETMSSTISFLKANNAEMKIIIDRSKTENNQLKADREIIGKEKGALEDQFKKLQNEIKLQSIVKYSNPPETLFVNGLIKPNIEGSKEVIERESTTKALNQLVNHSEKSLLRSLDETDKELQTVKDELTKVRNEVGFLRVDLDTGKFGLRNLTNENSALREELAKLRMEKQRLAITVHELGSSCK